MTDEEVNRRIQELEADKIESDAANAKLEIDLRKGKQYGTSGFYRNINPSDNPVENVFTSGESTPDIYGTFDAQTSSTFGNISGANPSATKFPLNIGSGNIEQLYDPSKIT